MARRDGVPYARRYRREGLLWRGEVFAMPKWLDAFMEEDRPRRVEIVTALTERGVRRKLARALWRRSHPDWKVRRA